MSNGKILPVLGGVALGIIGTLTFGRIAKKSAKKKIICDCGREHTSNDNSSAIINISNCSGGLMMVNTFTIFGVVCLWKGITGELVMRQ